MLPNRRPLSVGTPERRGSAVLPNRQPLVRLGWPPTTRQGCNSETSSGAGVQHRREPALRAEHRRQAAVVAEARCARRDATHDDAFEHLLWLHSCSGSLGVMNARRLSHLKNAGASAALEIARQDVLADVQQHISLSTLDRAQCVSDFSDVNNVVMLICECVLCVAPGTLTTRTLAR